MTWTVARSAAANEAMYMTLETECLHDLRAGKSTVWQAVVGVCPDSEGAATPTEALGGERQPRRSTRDLERAAVRMLQDERNVQCKPTRRACVAGHQPGHLVCCGAED